MADLVQLQREVEWRKCAKDFAHFCEHYVAIRHPEKGKIPFRLRQAQRETIDTIQLRENVLIVKARQIGYSTLMAVYSLWIVLFNSDKQIIFLSKTEREATKLLQKAKYAYKFLPEWMKERGPKLVTDHVMRMPFANDSSIESMPSKSEPARGESVWLVVVDEWAFLENPEEAWASIEPIADIGGQIVGLSTARGYGNFFHEMWVGATTGANDFVPLFYPWSANEDRGDEWYEAKARTLPDWQLHQEYPRNAEEAFIKSGNPVFDIERLQAIICWDPRTGHLSQIGAKSCQYVEGADGPLRVWEFPQPYVGYVVGADTAEGLEHGDYSSAHVIRLDSGFVVAHWHGHIDPDLFGEELALLGWWYNTALVGVESNNHGLTTLKALQRQFYSRIYRQRRIGARHSNETDQLGWRTTKTSKPVMIDELNMALRAGEVDLKCRFSIAELKTYVRDADGKMHGSPFDDRVVSLAVANQMRAHAFTPEYRVENDNYMTGDWWWDQLEQPQSQRPFVIGASNWRR